MNISRERRLPAWGDVSVLIAGGGINGAGLFRELAMQGVDVLLVEKSDFCAGTSAASTRIIHGGLRYLENAEFRLVRESLRERNLLLRNAPHYVKPLPTTIPLFDWTSGLLAAARNFLGMPTPPGSRGVLLVKTGLAMYDWLAGRNPALPRHRLASRRAARDLRPALNPRVVRTATYYDASITYPERLCLELVQDAEALNPRARAWNYVSVAGAANRSVVLRDEVSGETCEVRPRVVVNATGPWIDLANRSLGRESQFISGTKGSHVVLDHPELVEATRGEMIYFANRDGRVCIFYPFYGKVVAGSTDIPVSTPEAVCDDSEVDYILDAMRQVFPLIRVDRSHVVFRFCGVRPLPRSNALTPGQISRDYSIPILPPGGGIAFPVYSLVGGKWTTFRALAEQTTDQLLRLLGRGRTCHTTHVSIGGGKDWDASGDLPDKLRDRYGTRARELLRYLSAGPDAPLASLAEYSRREIQFIAEKERVVHLDDLVLRRTLIGLLGEANREVVEELAVAAAPVLNWSREDISREVERTVELLARVHGVNPSPGRRSHAESRR